MMDLLEQLGRTPARVVTDLASHWRRTPWDVRSWERPGWLPEGAPAPSTAGSPSRRAGASTPEDHEHHSRLYVADLRAVSGTRGHDADVKQVIGGLLRYSPEFSELWELRDVSVRRATANASSTPSWASWS